MEDERQFHNKKNGFNGSPSFRRKTFGRPTFDRLTELEWRLANQNDTALPVLINELVPKK
jgi:hypothetical protein